MVVSAWLPVHSADAAFTIAPRGLAFSYAFDGDNYLVGVEMDDSSPPVIAAQMVTPEGAKIGPLIKPGRTGISSTVAFDGNRYLMIWEDDAFGTAQNGFQIYGQFISKSGKLSGSPFAISDAKIWFDGIKVMAYGGGAYLVTYTRLINPAYGDSSNNRYIGGRIVYPDGTMSAKFRISTGYGDQSDVAFDGTNFFVVWCEDSRDSEIRGRFVSPTGICGAEISINASGAKSDNPKSVAFDGVNYLVVWNDEVGGARKWDVRGQLVSPSGALVGGVISLTSEPGEQMATTVAFDGINYMAVWVDMQNESDWNVFGQVVSTNGTLVGAKKAIATQGGNQMGGIGFANGTYLALVNTISFSGDWDIISTAAPYGVFIKPPATRLIGLSGNLSFGNVYTGETAEATLTITNRGNRDLTVDGITCPEGFSGDWSGVIAARQATDVTVTFAPEALQAYSGVVTVDSDMTGGENEISVSGYGMSDSEPGQVCFGASSYVAEEGGKGLVYVNRIYGSSGTVSVDYTTSPKTALPGQDYATRTGTLTWTNGQTAPQAIKISILADNKPEVSEVFLVTLSNPVGTSLALPSRTKVTILNK